MQELVCLAAMATNRPLQIVLDLDHTLLQAAMAPAVGTSTQHARPVHKFLLQASEDKPTRSVVRYVLGLRDGLHEFLKELRQLATVHVYTMGSKSYATEVIGIIDPTKELIVGRVLCRRDSAPEAFVKSLTHLFPEDEETRRAALILDDRQEAWDALSREHLIQVPAFHCFDKEDNSALPRPDVPDVTLMALLRVIRVVHLDWSRGVVTSAADSLRAHRQKVLRDTALVFSGGLHDPAKGPIERLHYWLLAAQCGARCEKSLHDRRITHVVSGRPDSNGVKRARTATLEHPEGSMHAVGAAAWSKWPSWWRHSWPPAAPQAASEGSGLPSALVRSAPSPQIPPRGRVSGATPRQTHVFRRV